MSVRRDRGCSATQSQPLYKATIWVNLPCVHQGIANTCSTGENALRGEYYGDLHFSLVSAYHRGVMYSHCSKFIHFSFFFSSPPLRFFHSFFFVFFWNLSFSLFFISQFICFSYLFFLFTFFFLIFTFLSKWKLLLFFLSHACFQMDVLVSDVTRSIGIKYPVQELFNRKYFEPHIIMVIK